MLLDALFDEDYLVEEIETISVKENSYACGSSKCIFFDEILICKIS